MAHLTSSLADEIRSGILAIERVGTITLLDVRVTESLGSDDEPVIRLALTLSDPVPGARTWPIDDIEALEYRARDVADAIEDDLPWLVFDLAPLTPDEPGNRAVSERHSSTSI